MNRKIQRSHLSEKKALAIKTFIMLLKISISDKLFSSDFLLIEET